MSCEGAQTICYRATRRANLRAVDTHSDHLRGAGDEVPHPRHLPVPHQGLQRLGSIVDSPSQVLLHPLGEVVVGLDAEGQVPEEVHQKQGLFRPPFQRQAVQHIHSRVEHVCDGGLTGLVRRSELVEDSESGSGSNKLWSVFRVLWRGWTDGGVVGGVHPIRLSGEQAVGWGRMKDTPDGPVMNRMGVGGVASVDGPQLTRLDLSMALRAEGT